MKFVYVAQSRTLSKNMLVIGLQGIVVKIGRTREMQTRLEGLSGNIDGVLSARYAGQIDWRMWRFRVASERTNDWWCDAIEVEKWLHHRFNGRNLLNHKEAGQWVKEQEWSSSNREELFLFQSSAELKKLFPYLASSQISDRTIAELEPIPPLPPSKPRLSALDEWRDRKPVWRPNAAGYF